MHTRTIIIIIAAAAVIALAIFLLGPLLARPEAPEAVPLPGYWPTDEWRTSTPEEQGFDSAALAKGLQQLRDDGIAIDSLLIIRNGDIILDAYFAPYDGTFAHDMASVTKSITTTLIAIAASQGRINLDAPMLSYFPDRTIANVDARKQAMTVRHLTGMVNGMESGCLKGDEPTLNAMRAAPDWIQHSLDRKMVRDPGLAFCYDSPGMHILSAILQQTTGMTEFEFARANLLEPLGIHQVKWESDPQGYTDGWGDIHLFPRDAAKLGYLWLSGGIWDGRQVVPADWVKDAVTAHVHADGGDDYGYGWWVSKDSYWALGRGGQHVKVYPALNAIVVVTASGLDFDQLEPMLRASFRDPEKPLPPNPEGVAVLNSTLTALAQPAEPFPVGPLPPMAKTVSGRTYIFGSDAAEALELKELSIDFQNHTEAILHMKGTHDEYSWPIGLDGTYRQTPDGRALRGYWSDESTFVFEMFDIGHLTYYLRFEDDRVLLTSKNVPGKFEGLSGNP
jgi:CubicO group peptidase (beta-lactamase class C family)